MSNSLKQSLVCAWAQPSPTNEQNNNNNPFSNFCLENIVKFSPSEKIRENDQHYNSFFLNSTPPMNVLNTSATQFSLNYSPDYTANAYSTGTTEFLLKHSPQYTSNLSNTSASKQFCLNYSAHYNRNVHDTQPKELFMNYSSQKERSSISPTISPPRKKAKTTPKKDSLMLVSSESVQKMQILAFVNGVDDFDDLINMLFFQDTHDKIFKMQECKGIDYDILKNLNNLERFHDYQLLRTKANNDIAAKVQNGVCYSINCMKYVAEKKKSSQCTNCRAAHKKFLQQKTSFASKIHAESDNNTAGGVNIEIINQERERITSDNMVKSTILSTKPKQLQKETAKKDFNSAIERITTIPTDISHLPLTSVAYEVETMKLLQRNDFKYIYFLNCLENLKKVDGKFTRWNPEVQNFLLYLKYLSNKRVINFFHCNKMSLGGRSLRNIKFNLELNEIWEDFVNVEGNKELLKNKKLFIDFDEIILRQNVDLHGDKVYGMGDVMSCEDFVKNFEMFDRDKDVADRIIQFFVVDSSNTVCIPVGAFSRNSLTSNLNEMLMKIMSQIVAVFNKQGIEIGGSISDCDCNANAICQGMSKNGKTWIHIFDPSHVLKCMRNQLLSQNPQMNGITFSMKTLVNLITENECLDFIPQNCVSPSDIQNCDNVFNLIQNQIISKLLFLKKNEIENTTIPPKIAEFVSEFLSKKLSDVQLCDLISAEFENDDDNDDDDSENEIPTNQNTANITNSISNNDSNPKELTDLDVLNFNLDLNNVKYSSDALAYYFIVMRKILLISRIPENKTEKLQRISSLLGFLEAWKASKDTLIHPTTFDNVNFLMHQFQKFVSSYEDGDEVCLSSLTTDVCENHFSLMRAKNPKVTCKYYIERCSAIFYIKNIITNENSFLVEKKKISRSYNNSECKLNLPILKNTDIQKTKKKAYLNELRIKFRKLNEDQQSFVFRNTVKRGAVKVICPIPGCTHHKLYSKIKCFETHLAREHKIPFKVAAMFTKYIKRETINYTNTIESQKRKQSAKFQSNASLSTVINLQNADKSIADETAATQTTDNENNTENLQKKTQSNVKCIKCNKRGCKTCTNQCCKKCCLSLPNSVCPTHNHNSISININEFTLLVHDFETTGTAAKAPVEYSILRMRHNEEEFNLTRVKHNRYVALVNTIIKPREKINYTGYKTHHLTDAYCNENGITEKAFVEQLDKLLPQKCILISHNAPFERQTFENLFSAIGMENIFKKRQIIFLDTIQLFKSEKKYRMFTQNFLAKQILDVNYEEEHRSLSDSEDLYDLLFEQAKIKNMTMTSLIEDFVKKSPTGLHLYGFQDQQGVSAEQGAQSVAIQQQNVDEEDGFDNAEEQEDGFDNAEEQEDGFDNAEEPNEEDSFEGDINTS